MTNITINSKKNTIEITKTFNAAASNFGSDEYKELKEARTDFPTFKVVIVTRKTSTTTFKGLTFEYMEKYIKVHDNAEKTIIKEYMELRGLTDEAREMDAESASYQDIQHWFLETFPAIKKYHEKRAADVKKIADERKAEKEQKQKEAFEKRLAALLA